MYRLLSLLGILVFIMIALALSENRKAVAWRTVIYGLALQIVFALLILKTGFGRIIFAAANKVFEHVLSFSDKGASFVFGNLVNNYEIGAIFAFKVLPIIIFVSALMGVLYYLGIIQFFVVWGARIMHKTLKISGAESLAAALFVFMGIETTTAIK